MTLALHYALRSDVGLLREGNEDSAYAGPAAARHRGRDGRARGRRGGQRGGHLSDRAAGPAESTDSEDMLDALAAAVAAPATPCTT